MPRRLPDVLANRAAARPGKIAHDDTRTTLTYGEWNAAANEIAGGLAAAGVAPGDRVLLPIANARAVDFCVAYIAVMRAGAIAVPLNTRLASAEITHFQQLTGAQWCITDTQETCAAVPLRGSWIVDEMPRALELLPDQSALPADADADILSTSGTTGLPKGVVFSHADLLDGLDGDDWSRAGTLLHALPFTGFGGCHGLMLSTLRFGHTLVTQPKFDARGFLELVAVHRPNTVHLVPSMLRLILDLPDVAGYDLSSVRWIITGTAPLPNDSVRQSNDLWPGARVINVYGMTEGSAGTSTRTQRSALKPGSVGQPADPSSVQIRDASGEVLPHGQAGEIWTRVRLQRRYWNDPEATRGAWQDGWLRTGDLGYIDRDGDLILTGRAKELIIRGGYNISPGEVEEVLHDHPDVLEAAVVGIPHDVLGEDVAAAVVVRAGSTVDVGALQEWCRTRLADNKVPRDIAILDALPYNQNGKVLKRDLVQLLTRQSVERRQSRRRGSTSDLTWPDGSVGANGRPVHT
jgi:acyl-CoA synthetase (AMP-forming)/AMP-acid ligase II